MRQRWRIGFKAERLGYLVDRGPEGIAATLYQQEESTGFWKPVNYTSRTQMKTEQKYSQVEGESLAIQVGIISNRMYLYGKPFVVVTDHQPSILV